MRLQEYMRARWPRLARAWHHLRSLRYAFSNTRAVFTHIYNTNQWGDTTSFSGPGSNPANTAAILAGMPVVLDRYEIESILDIPCGDFSWMQHLSYNGNYIGADIVPTIIRRNRSRYANTKRRFFELDLLTDDLPTVDLILCRDCMVHLSTRQVLRSIRNILATGSTYLLATDFPRCDRNTNIITGCWRPISLEKKPFNLPPPIYRIEEPESLCPGKTLSLWRLADICDSLS